MKLFAILSTILLFFESALSDFRIIGGQDGNIEDFRYLVSIKHNGEHICTGGKFAGSYVLTVAQCVIGLNPENVTVRAGSSYKSSGGTLHQVVNITLDHRYNPRNLDYDIAVLQRVVEGWKVMKQFRPWIRDQNAQKQKMIRVAYEIRTPDKILHFSKGYSSSCSRLKSDRINGSFPRSESSFLKLPDKTYSFPEDYTFGNVTGWGRLQTGGPMSEVLQVIEVPIVNFKVCQYNYKKLTQRMFCAGYMSGLKGACVGDIGAPFHVNGTTYGFFSWSYGCSEPSYAGVFTNFQETIEFIKSIVH